MPLIAEGSLTSLLLLAGVLLVAFAVLRNSFRAMSSSSAHRDSKESRQLPAVVPDSLTQWEVEMHDIARELSARLDNKIRLLETLLREAQAQEGRLAALLERAEAVGGGPPRPSEVVPASQPASESSECGETAPTANRDESSFTVRRRHSDIYNLADEGKSALEIAGMLHQPLGEVELILGLRKAKA